MRDTFALRLKEKRRQRGMSQEQLAAVCGVSVQAVSKWECAQSYPDIELLEIIADTFGVTIDALLREGAEASSEPDTDKAEDTKDTANADERLLSAVAEKFGVRREDIESVDVHMSTGEGTLTDVFGGEDIPGIRDDGVLRVVQFLGKRPLGKSEFADAGERIPLALSDAAGHGEIKVEIWGDADIEIGENKKGMSVSLNVGGDVTVNGASVNGSVKAGGDVSCGGVGGSVSAGGDVNCGGVGGSASANGDVNCGAVCGGASAGGDVNCGDVSGSLSAGGDVSCGNVDGDICAGGDVNCGDVDGDISAGGDVECNDVEGSVEAGGGVECGSIGGRVSADGANVGKQSGRVEHISFDIPDFSMLGEQISRKVNKAMERAFGSQNGSGGKERNDADDDALFAEALELAVSEGKISNSRLQQKLRVSYGEAERLISKMEAFVYIKKDQDSRMYRTVITRQELDEIKGKSQNENK